MNGRREDVKGGSSGNVEGIIGELSPGSFAVIPSLGCRHLKSLFIESGNEGWLENFVNMVKGQMGNKRGNPAWYRGMLSANPKGRPKGQTSLEAFRRDPKSFRVWLYRWERFCWALPMTKIPGNGAEAARKAGYSPKSARFIASRLGRKPIIREILRRIRKRIDGTRKIGEGVYLIPDDSGEYHIYYRNKKYR